MDCGEIGKMPNWRKSCQSPKLLFHKHYAQHLITRKEFSFGVLGCPGRREFHGRESRMGC